MQTQTALAHIESAIQALQTGAGAAAVKEHLEKALSLSKVVHDPKDRHRIQFLVASIATASGSSAPAATLPPSVPPLSVSIASIPQPISVVMEKDGLAKPVGERGGLPDRMTATLKVAEVDKNPEIKPYNAQGNYDESYTFEKIAGADLAKRLLQRALIDPFNAPNLFPESVIIRRLLLYGVPGTGKSSVATAAVNAITGFRSESEVAAFRQQTEEKLPGFVDKFWPDSTRVPRIIYFQATLGDVKSPWFGESGRRLERYFEIAGICSPSILFLDEADAYLDPTDKNNSDAITAVKQQTEGIEKDKQKGVTLIVATNYPMRIESAIRSRLAGAAELSLPDRASRLQIVKTEVVRAFAGTPMHQFAMIGQEDIYNAIADETSPFDSSGNIGTLWSGRDLSNLIRAALLVGRASVIAPDAYVKPCTAADGGEPGPCKYYAGEQVYVPAVASDPGAVLASTVISNNQGNQIRPIPVTLENFRTARRDFNPSVTGDSVFDQMQFNKERSLAPYGPDDPKSQATQTKVEDWLRSKGYVPKDGGVYGKNTTVPND